MIRAGQLARQVVVRPVRLTTGESVSLALAVTFDRNGAVIGVSASTPPAPLCGAAETAGGLLVQAIGDKLRRRPDLGLAELHRRAEVALALIEQLQDIEAAHGGQAVALLRDAA